MKLLFILNPVSGKLKGISNIDKILDIFKEKYEVTLVKTTKKGDGTVLAMQHAKDYDAVAACGGDGTLNEVMLGLLNLGIADKIPMYCIPAGTTNLVGDTLGFPKDVIKASQKVIEAPDSPYDLGTFNDEIFCSVVAFGAFTDTSYAISQKLKNRLGYGAYVIGGAKSIFHLHNYEMEVTIDDNEPIHDKFIFGGISNCRAVGGVVKFPDGIVQVDDGKYEIVLIRKFRSPAALFRVIGRVLKHKYDNSKDIVYAQADRVKIRITKPIPWTIDGEYKGDFDNIDINVKPNAIHIFK